MASTYSTPGVYVEEIAKFPPSIAQVETAIPAFIGFTEKAAKEGRDLGPLQPVRISSLLEYEQIFGKAQAEENFVVNISKVDGETKYVVDFDRAEGKGPSRHLMYYALQQFFDNGGGPCYIISTGGFGKVGEPLANLEEFSKALAELRKLDEPTLIVIPEGQNMDKDSYFTLLQEALTQCFDLKDRFVIIDLHDDGRNLKTDSEIKAVTDVFRKAMNQREDYLRYGAAYFPNIRSSRNYFYSEDKIVVNKDGAATPFSALKSLEKENVKLAINNFSIFLPPSGSIAGVYARVDNARGVWKAPANESINAVFELTCYTNNQMQEQLNIDVDAGKSINAIRSFNRGILVWGARTLDGNSNEWRYVPVRRFFNMVEESTKKATEAFVFEPNDANTWVKVRAMIENFLLLQWRAGALAGAKPEHAFYVKVGLNETMTALDILEGRMIVEIGMAVVRPAEFIILQFSHKMQES
jgi:phage tail sheath protein FI